MEASTAEEYAFDVFVKGVIEHSVAHQAVEDGFKNLLQLVYGAVAIGEASSADTMSEVFSDLEKKYKKQYNVTSMPASYRSSKSVLLSALKNELIFSSSVSKSELDKMIKNKKQDEKLRAASASPSSASVHTLHKLKDAVREVRKTSDTHLGTGEQIALKEYIADVFKLLTY